MPETVYTMYGCTHKDCPVALAFKEWPVPVDATGVALDESDTVCPECYSAGQQVAARG